MYRIRGKWNSPIPKSMVWLIAFIGIINQWPANVMANNITEQVFGDVKEGIIAAFGDFNSDELTDVFIIREKMTQLQILFGAETEPLLRQGPVCNYSNHQIIGVIPGDFDGDALMDLIVLLRPQPRRLAGESDDKIYKVYVNWGSMRGLQCTYENETALIKTRGEPLALDYNRDMTIDLYGMDEQGDRLFWIFQKTHEPPKVVKQAAPSVMTAESKSSIHMPNANAYLDLNGDFIADLFVQTDKGYELWYGRAKEDFTYNDTIGLRFEGDSEHTIGQAVFTDFELKGTENIILPICFRKDCDNSTIYVYNNNSWVDVHVSFKDTNAVKWGFVPPTQDDVYLKTITARSGDYNMDGYPDLLLTLQSLSGKKRIQTFLLENVKCKWCSPELERTFEVKWDALNPMGANTVAGAFYDFYQDGVLDVILIEKTNNYYRPLAFRNTLDYDANFVKVIVLTGLVNEQNPTQHTPLGRKKRTYGTNLPGPRITYTTTTQEGDVQRGSSVQLPQSSYFALQLPYTIFGLGRTPNFVDSLTVGLSSKSRIWTQLIPNSQIIVVPKPVENPQLWKAQLFVTPSKLILMSVVALGGTCLVIVLIILGLYIKEKREDKQEKLQEAHRFHFDAM